MTMLLRQPQHFISIDGSRFAPVRLVRELGSGMTFPVKARDGVAFSRLRPELTAQGWITVEAGQPAFESVFQSWYDWCVKFGPDNTPRNWSGSDPKTGRSFTVPG
ncbi:hypothetical protein AB9K41_24325 [Cribrihabitans sp. XS_ASV171]